MGNLTPIPPNAPEIITAPEIRERQLTIEVVPRHLKMHQVSENEFDTIASQSNSVNLPFFCLCAGLFIAFWIVLYNGGLDQGRHTMYASLTFVAGVLSAYFLAATVVERLKWYKTVKGIKRGSVITKR